MKATNIIKYFFSMLGIILLSIGSYLSYTTYDFLQKATSVKGHVIALVQVGKNYRPKVEFTDTEGKNHEVVIKISSNPPGFKAGDTVGILYLADDIENARINGIFSLWILPMVILLDGIIFGGIGFTMLIIDKRRKNTINYLTKHGITITATFKEIRQNPYVKVNNKRPYQIIAQWKDGIRNQLYTFHSQNIWSDPSAYIEPTNLTIYIERNNPKKYYMDISFLPKNII